MAIFPDPTAPLYRLIARNLHNTAVIVFDSDLRFLVAEGPALEAAGYSKQQLEGNTLKDVFPDQYQELLPIYQQVLQGQSFTVERTREKSTYRASTVPLRGDNGEINFGMLIIQDVTELKQLAVQEREQRVFAENLTRMLSKLTGSLDINTVLDSMLDAVDQVVPFDAAAIMLLDEKGVTIVRHRGVDFGIVPSLDINQPFRIENAIILNQLYRIRTPIIIRKMDAPTFPATLFTHFPWIRAYIGAPMVAGDEVVGFINLASRIEGFFEPLHAGRLSSFATQAAIAIQNARAYQQAKNVAAMEEQRRIAQGLHDSVTQVLFSANMLAHSLPRLWANGEPVRIEDLDTLGALTKGALAEMRTMLVELRPETIQTTDLAELIEHLAFTLPARRNNIHITMDSAGIYPLLEPVQTAIYRIAQEWFAIIARRTQVRNVQVALTRTTDSVDLRITDDHTPGGSTDIDSLAPTMQSRAAAIGATLTLEGVPDHGTTLRLYWESLARPTV